MAAVESLLQSLQWLQDSREYSDLKILCGEETFHVHKAIICSRSKWFETACKWGTDGKHGDELRLEDDDPILVGLMIDYLYRMDYDDISPSRKTAEASNRGVENVEPPVAFSSTYNNNFNHEDEVQEAPQNGDTFGWGFNQSSSSTAVNDDDNPAMRKKTKKKKGRYAPEPKSPTNKSTVKT